MGSPGLTSAAGATPRGPSRRRWKSMELGHLCHIGWQAVKLWIEQQLLSLKNIILESSQKRHEVLTFFLVLWLNYRPGKRTITNKIQSTAVNTSFSYTIQLFQTGLQFFLSTPQHWTFTLYSFYSHYIKKIFTLKIAQQTVGNVLSVKRNASYVFLLIGSLKG